jgi:uncharacterized protein VirK/YbjX
LRGGQTLIHDLTKFYFGYRPKNLILHGIRSVARSLGLKKLYAVSNYGFYAYSTLRIDRKIKTSLDQFWLETGGELCADKRFYQLPLVEPRKAIEEAASHKRNLYRKRYAAIDAIDEAVTTALAGFSQSPEKNP